MNTCNSCSSNKKSDRNTKEVARLDTAFSTSINDMKVFLTITIKIEALKSEKRMIQSCDRKLWDMNRQSEIDQEIEKLEKQIKK
jgi:hypothetical protein